MTDLLRSGQRVGAWAGVAAEAVNAGAAAQQVPDRRALQKALAAAEGAKRRAATAMNERSSRAHSLTILSLKQRRALRGGCGGGPPPWAESRLCLADLGGSEQVAKSGVSADRARMAEAVRINLSLLALKRVIDALAEGNGAQPPFGDSRLTQLLMPALSGRAAAVLVVTCR